MSETLPQEKEPLPYNPLVMEDEWRRGQVLPLAESIYEKSQFEALPILADALEEQGCTDSNILSHLRNNTCPHHKGCWALGLVLGGDHELESSIEVIRDQMLLYAKHFKRELDLSTVELPERTKEQKKEFIRLLIIDKKLTTEEAYQACKKEFHCYHYQEERSLDELIDPEQEERNPQTQGSYAIWVEDSQNAPERNANLSANQIKERKLQTMTLRERLYDELYHWDKNSSNPDQTQRHLDSTNTYTHCSGSRHVGGHVPCVCWYSFPRKMFVLWSRPGDRDAALRARSVVSLPAKPSEARVE